jgi:hypothetical protein
VTTVVGASLTNAGSVESDQIPAKQYLEEKKLPLIAVMEFRQIYNWFENYVPKRRPKMTQALPKNHPLS